MAERVSVARGANVTLDAFHAVNEDRQKEYGDPIENAVREAIIMSVTTEFAATPTDMVQAFLAKKMVRSGKPYRRDTQVDIAGFSEILDRVRVAELEGKTREIARKLVGHLL